MMVYRVTVTYVTKQDPHTFMPFFYLSLIVPYIIVILHSYRTFGLKKTLVFQMLSGFIGFLAEFIGINYGYIFGGIYSYGDIFIKVYNVPLIVFFMWGAFTYIGYVFTNSFFIWLGKKNPVGIIENLIFVLLNTFIITSMDLLLEPIEIYHKQWYWQTPGRFFGAPVNNFLGWMLTTGLITLFFRLYEIRNPNGSKIISSQIYLIGVAGYATFAVSHFLLGTLLGMNLPFIVGLIPVFFVFSNLWLFSLVRPLGIEPPLRSSSFVGASKDISSWSVRSDGLEPSTPTL